MARAATAALAIAALSLLTAACQSRPQAPPRKDTIWRPVGTWSGKGPLQSESWPGDTGAMRITWRTSRSDADGTFTLTIHSAISGRPIQTVVEHAGDGDGVAYFADDPRVYFAVVDAQHLDWTFTIDEPVDVILTPK